MHQRHRMNFDVIADHEFHAGQPNAISAESATSEKPPPDWRG